MFSSRSRLRSFDVTTRVCIVMQCAWGTVVTLDAVRSGKPLNRPIFVTYHQAVSYIGEIAVRAPHEG